MVQRNDGMKKNDEHICKYFAARYSSAVCPFDDLMQEGFMAILQAKKEAHRWLAVRRAIQTFVERANKTCHGHPQAFSRGPLAEQVQDRRTGEASPVQEDLDQDRVDNLELIERLLDETDLTELEYKSIILVYLEELTFPEAAVLLDVHRASVARAAREGLAKVRALAQKKGLCHAE